MAPFWTRVVHSLHQIADAAPDQATAYDTVVAVHRQREVGSIERTVAKGREVTLDSVETGLCERVARERPKAAHAWLSHACDDVAAEAELLFTGEREGLLHLLTRLPIQIQASLRLLQVAVIQIL